MFFVIGTKFIAWGSEKTPDMMRCGQCGTVTQFKQKTGMRFITVFFIFPVIPISGKSKMVECPNCKTRYQSE
jgi:uncharacterized Zn finger protein